MITSDLAHYMLAQSSRK